LIRVPGNGSGAVNTISMDYLGRVFNLLLLERLVKDNLKSCTHDFRGIFELVQAETWAWSGLDPTSAGCAVPAGRVCSLLYRRGK